jgi:hypothetical protein
MTTTRLLRVEGIHYRTKQRFVAGAEFEEVDGVWRCVRAAPILGWFINTPVENITTWLRGPAYRKGVRYEWINND